MAFMRNPRNNRWLVTIICVFSWTSRLFLKQIQKRESKNLFENQRFEDVKSKETREYDGSILSIKLEDEIKINNQKSKKTWGLSHKVSNLVILYYKYSLALLALEFLKYSIICLLDYDLLHEYRWLDCYLLGRLLIDARIASEIRYLSLFFLTYNLVWKSFVLRYEPVIDFEVIEFLLHEPNELLMHEMDSGRVEQAIKTELTVPSTGDEGGSKDQQHDWRRRRGTSTFELRPSLKHGKISMSRRRPTFYSSAELEDNPVLFLNYNISRNLNRKLLKPNRTFGCWNFLSQSTVIFIVCFYGSFTLVLLFLTYFLTSPVMATKKGFEITYLNCVDWISNQTEQVAAEYSHIYKPCNRNDNTCFRGFRGPTPVRLPWSDLVEMNNYHRFRLMMELFDNLFIWIETCSIVYATCIGILNFLDIHSYSNGIESQLTRIKKELTYRSMSGRGDFLMGKNITFTHQIRPNRFKLEMLDAQALVIDYMSYVNRINCFASLYIMLNIGSWFIFSTGACNYLFVPDKTSKETNLEWHVAQVLFTTYLYAVMVSYGMIKVSSERIYKSITSIMALDVSSRSNRSRWAKILRYFRPKPMHCIIVMGNTEISLMLTIKVSFYF